MTVRRRVTVGHDPGLHARPAREVVDLASSFEATVAVRPTASDESAALESVLSLTALGLQAGEDVVVAADGEEARAAVEAVGDAIAEGAE
ncbi:HPr family phosphocarrier protein [Halosimplex aquaticum]|uniref:HPr family phosphocarrier protein n=1 Tax=Halosimplex aquaticum TaxID=3026162 RepID=A0ABD5Y723_9EURY|nr:HPr family phosphocarrier protein [Halosimplex aquaticum]